MTASSGEGRVEPPTPGATSSEVDAWRSDLATALAHTLVGFSESARDSAMVHAARHVANMRVVLLQSTITATARAAAGGAAGDGGARSSSSDGPKFPPVWLWGEPVIANRGCYDGNAAGFPFSLQLPLLLPLTARLYIRRI